MANPLASISAMPESGQGTGLPFKGSDTKAFSFNDLSIFSKPRSWTPKCCLND